MSEMKVLPIKFQEVREWLTHKHYARRTASVSYAFGLFDGGILKGVCTFGVPASPHLCIGICGEEYRGRVIEFNRLCIEEPHSSNEASKMVSSAIRQLPPPMILVSYADTGMGHVGYIYQATNWLYTGLTDAGRKTPRSDRISDPLRHGRHSGKIIKDGIETADKSCCLVYRKPKHRYVMFLGSKKQKKEMIAALRYPILPYPKGESKRYDASHKPATQMRMF